MTTAIIGNRVSDSFARSWTANPANCYEVKAHASSVTTMPSNPSANFYEVKVRDSRSDSSLFDDLSIDVRLQNLGIQILKPFNDLHPKTGKPICPARMPFNKFVEWLEVNARALNECAHGAEQADTIAEIFKSNLTDRCDEIVPLIPCIELSKAKNRKKGDFPTVVSVPLIQSHRYFKNEAGYFSGEALLEVQEAKQKIWASKKEVEAREAKQKILTSKEEVDAIVVEAAKSEGITWEYKRDGCELRARTLYQALRCMGLAKKNLFLQYYVGEIKRFDWTYHVALGVELSNGQLLIIDPAFDANSSMTVQDWVRKFHNDTEYKLTTNHVLGINDIGSEVFRISCDHRFSRDCKIATYNEDFLDDYAHRTGVFSAILRLKHALAKTPRLSVLLQEVWKDFRQLWLPTVWKKFKRLKLFDIKSVEGKPPILEFNFTLDEIKALTWFPGFIGMGIPKIRARKLFDAAITSCKNEIGQKVESKLNAQTIRALERYIKELVKKKKYMDNH